MPSETRLILQMTRNSILRSKEEVTITEKINWSEVFSIAYRNNIAPFLFDQIMKIEEKSHIDDSVFQKWKQCTMFTSVAEYRKNFALRQIFGEAKKAGIGLILFKGPILANLYPNYALRASCDTDILIKDADKELLFGLVEKLGYHRILVSEDNVYTFESKQYNHRLELHTTLYGQHTGPRIDVLNAMELTKKDSLREMEACGMKVITLGYVEQLIYLMFHMIKHFTLEGISLRHLLDIVLYINAYIDRIDKDIFWSAMQRLGYDSCCIVFFSLGIQYMGLDERILIKRKVSDVKVVNQLLMDIMNHGLVREENKKVFQLWGMMEPYMVGTTRARQGKKSNFITFLKPIDKKYDYARKYKILLPICWIHKVCSYIYSRHILNNGVYTPLEKVKIAESRLDLLQDVGLIEKR